MGANEIRNKTAHHGANKIFIGLDGECLGLMVCLKTPSVLGGFLHFRYREHRGRKDELLRSMRISKLRNSAPTHIQGVST